MPGPDADDILRWLDDVGARVQEAVDGIPAGTDLRADVGMGADGTPTWHVDRVAEAVIIDALDDAPVPMNLVSEESPRLERGAERTLVIDPIDGSRNLVRGVPFYAVSMAVGRQAQSDIEAGLVRNLASGQVYKATKGGGATLDGRRIHVRAFDPAEAFLCANPTYDPEMFDRGRGNVHLRTMGAAALEICMVAQGAADVFVARKPYLRIVDVAAANLIVREAGGGVLTPERVDFESTFDVVRRLGLIAYGDLDALEVVA